MFVRVNPCSTAVVVPPDTGVIRGKGHNYRTQSCAHSIVWKPTVFGQERFNSRLAGLNTRLLKEVYTEKSSVLFKIL